MACPFSNVYNPCGCLIGYELPLQTEEDIDITEFPVEVLNVDGDELGQAGSPSEYVTIWNSDPANQAYGILFVGTSTFCFYLKKINEAVPPSNVFGRLAEPPEQVNFIFGFTELDTTGAVPAEAEYLESVDDVFTAGDEQSGFFPDNGNVQVNDFENGTDKVLFIQVPASQEPFTKWSEVGNPLQQNKPINPNFASGSGLFYRAVHAGETIYITRYQTSFTGAVVLSR